MRASTLLVGLLVFGSTAAFAQHRDERGRRGRQAEARGLTAERVLELVRFGYLEVLQREPEHGADAQLAHWWPRVGGLREDAAWTAIVAELRASEEFQRHHLVMPEAHFAGLVAQLQATPFSSSRVSLVQAAAPHHRFDVAQLRRLLALVPFSVDRLAMVAAVGPRLVDRGNAYLLADSFTFSSDREEAMRLLLGH